MPKTAKKILITYLSLFTVLVLYFAIDFSNYVYAIYLRGAFFLTCFILYGLAIFFSVSIRNIVLRLIVTFALIVFNGIFLLGLGWAISKEEPTTSDIHISPDREQTLILLTETGTFLDKQFTVVSIPKKLGLHTTVFTCEDCYPKFIKWVDSKHVKLQYGDNKHACVADVTINNSCKMP